MEKINGISFEDWACACGNLANGMSEDEICSTLGIEMPVWQQTNDLWSSKLGDLMTENMEVATQYGELFANPKQGKFAQSSTEEVSLEDLLKIAPDYDAYMKISTHQSKASEVGIDPTTVLNEYGITIGSWGKLNMHYMKWRNEYTDAASGTPMEKERFDFFSNIHKKWDQYWDAHFQENKSNLVEDIDF